MNFKPSYECEDLIKKLEDLISEFGNIEMYAFFENVEGFTFITNFDLIEDEKPLTSEEIGDAIIQIMKAEEILKILKEQNRLI